MPLDGERQSSTARPFARELTGSCGAGADAAVHHVTALLLDARLRAVKILCPPVEKNNPANEQNGESDRRRAEDQEDLLLGFMTRSN